jgi:putative phosphoribosyl transferase
MGKDFRMLFNDRQDAGRQLASKLMRYKDLKNVIVLGLARGGVVTAAEVARLLHVALNVIVVRKIGAPDNEELALGAVAEHGEGIFNGELIELLGVSSRYLQMEVERQKKILKERLDLYRGSTLAPELKGKMVILVDDGIATGASMRVAIQSLRQAGVEKLVMAVPIAAFDSLRRISQEVDETVCLSSPLQFGTVGLFYRNFEQTSDEEVVRLLTQHYRQ